MTEYTFSLRDIAATDRLAWAFAQVIDQCSLRKAVVALNGPLGVGKTKFVQALADELGVEELVNSPTFTMLNEYHSGRLPLFHFDLYRLSEGTGATAASMLDLELAEIMDGPHLIIIEWAELLEKPELSGANFLSGLDHLVANFSYGRVPEEVTSSASDNSSSLYTHLPEQDQARLVRIHSYGPQSERLLSGVSEAVAELADK